MPGRVRRHSERMVDARAARGRVREQALAAACEAKHAVAVSSCTAALHLSLLVSGIGPGDEVICPSMSFIATANAIRHVGATPVFADVNPETYNLDPEAAEAALTSRQSRHAGAPDRPARRPGSLPNDCGTTGLQLIEDAACAIGSRYQGRAIRGGRVVGLLQLPSSQNTLHEGKRGNRYGERGDRRPVAAIATSRHEHLRFRSPAQQKIVVEEYLCVGYNYRMTDLQAAIGIEQLKRLPRILTDRRRLAARYTEALKTHPWLRPPYAPPFAEPNFQSYAVQLIPQTPLDRNELMQALLDRGIATRRGIMLAHRERPYAEASHASLPGSELASDRSLLLPLFPQLTAEEQDCVIAALFQLA